MKCKKIKIDIVKKITKDKSIWKTLYNKYFQKDNYVKIKITVVTQENYIFIVVMTIM